MNNGKPKFLHDCSKCVYLGTTITGVFQDNKQTNRFVDHYICGRTVLARFSDEVSDYASTSCGYVVSGRDLLTSTILAFAKGLLKMDADFLKDIKFYVTNFTMGLEGK
jgi:hypothetical protein